MRDLHANVLVERHFGLRLGEKINCVICARTSVSEQWTQSFHMCAENERIDKIEIPSYKHISITTQVHTYLNGSVACIQRNLLAITYLYAYVYAP